MRSTDSINRLFATATALLEDAAQIAVSGQSSRRSVRYLAQRAADLRKSVHDLAAIANAAETLARLATEGSKKRNKAR